jgi:spoIIIJ-associated protein
METVHETRIRECLDAILKHLQITVNEITSEADPKLSMVRFVVSSPDSALLIGERGARLLALNYLLKKIIEKDFPGVGLSFMVDVNDYQKKHVDELRAKAHMLAERARYFKSSVEMDPMSSYERLIIHAEFTDVPDIKTESTGGGKDRRVVIRYVEKAAE